MSLILANLPPKVIIIIIINNSMGDPCLSICCSNTCCSRVPSFSPLAGSQALSRHVREPDRQPLRGWTSWPLSPAVASQRLWPRSTWPSTPAFCPSTQSQVPLDGSCLWRRQPAESYKCEYTGSCSRIGRSGAAG
jgi:hypothetical protein